MLKILDEHYVTGLIQIKKLTPNFKSCVPCKHKHGKTQQMFIPLLKYYNFTRVYEGVINLQIIKQNRNTHFQFVIKFI